MVRPYGGPHGDGAGNGAASIPVGTSGERAMAIGIGINAVIGDHDAYAMAWHVADEAVRNAVIAGADPDELSLLDNFAFGNPNNPDTLGQLVAACKGCYDAAINYNAPFVSGKDSSVQRVRAPRRHRRPGSPDVGHHRSGYCQTGRQHSAHRTRFTG